MRDDAVTRPHDPAAPVPPRGSATRSTCVAIVGAGFGGLEVARELGRAGIPALVIDRQNHHTFQPLLYQVATAALSAPDIAQPIRSMLRPYRSVEVLLGEVEAIDHDARRLSCADGLVVSYDHLVLAAGARTSYFGHDGWARAAPGLKTIEDARGIRSRLLLAFERAEEAQDPEERARLMTFAVIGGGPTGVEMAGSIAELARHTLVRDFRRIRPAEARIHLIEAGPRILGSFHEELGRYAEGRLEALGVTVRTNSSVEQIDEEGLVVSGQRMGCGLVVFAAGVTASPLARSLGVETDRGGRIPVAPTLEVPGRPGAYALGDVAACPGQGGHPLPGLAQVASQQGRHLGRALAARVRDGAALPAFVYRSRGNPAIIGRHSAVYETGRYRIKGWPAWALWAIVHVYLLMGFQNRLLVAIQWLWRYLTFHRGARLITGATTAEARAP
jgi:NADH dehydrogenase